jgi:hypothetical protein
MPVNASASSNMIAIEVEFCDGNHSRVLGAYGPATRRRGTAGLLKVQCKIDCTVKKDFIDGLSYGYCGSSLPGWRSDKPIWRLIH